MACPSPPDADSPVAIRGKFFTRHGARLPVRGVTYGPFPPNGDGLPFPERWQVVKDVEMMREAGLNTVRLFDVPPAWLLDELAARGLLALVGVPWPLHLRVLDRPAVRAAARDQVRAAAAVARHPAVLGLLMGNEIPPGIVRWHGRARVEAFLRDLYGVAKAAAPALPVSYANFPSTEYLQLDFLDFLAFNVYLHRPEDFARYLRRLQNLAGGRPLLLSEVGFDAVRQGLEGQAQGLAWQLPLAERMGTAGVVVFSWTDDWCADGVNPGDWTFGLVDAERRRKPAFYAVRDAFLTRAAALPPPGPRASVVVAAYNAAATLPECLAALARQRYRDLEVVVVDDGSTDGTAAIASAAPGVRLVRQEHRGLSAARNAGIRAATGAIVAFVDADCAPDPDWVAFLVDGLQAGGYAGIGGPNLPPPSASLTAAALAAAPGAPTHVLLDDELADHVPGCNMAFWRETLEEAGEFDAVFIQAGDDVDLCCRLQAAGQKIGFTAGAFVWHRRRETIPAYLRQQWGYGRAEALLLLKHPSQFAGPGLYRWAGRVYGDSSAWRFPIRPLVYFGRFGSAPFQRLYENGGGWPGILASTLEWNTAGWILLVLASRQPAFLVPALFLLGAAAGNAFRVARRAAIEPAYDGWRARALLGLLAYVQPLVRGLGRYSGLFRHVPTGGSGGPGRGRVGWEATLWSEAGIETPSLLEACLAGLRARTLPAATEGWARWDIEAWVTRLTLVRVRGVTEHHGGGRRLLHLRWAARPSLLCRWGAGALAFLALAGGTAGLPALALGSAAGLAALAGGWLLGRRRAGAAMMAVVEAAARDLGLFPIAGPAGVARDVPR